MPARRSALVLCIAWLATSGCAGWQSRRNLDYRTIQANPHHDSERARAENQRALALIDKGKFDKAEQALQRALIADVTYGPAHNNLGKVYFSAAKYYLAAWEFEYAAKLMPHRVECQNNIGLVYEKVGKLDEAIDAYTAAHGMNDKNPIVIGNLARARVRRGDSDPVVRKLLGDLRLYDDRREWVAWANERLALGRPPDVAAPSTPTNDSHQEATQRGADGQLELLPPPRPDVEPSEESPLTWPDGGDAAAG